MILFSGIYGLKIVAGGTLLTKSCTGNKINAPGMTTLVVAILLVVVGLLSMVKILTTHDSETNNIATEKQFAEIAVKDLTGENYFANFSLIV